MAHRKETHHVINCYNHTINLPDSDYECSLNAFGITHTIFLTLKLENTKDIGTKIGHTSKYMEKNGIVILGSWPLWIEPSLYHGDASYLSLDQPIWVELFYSFHTFLNLHA